MSEADLWVQQALLALRLHLNELSQDPENEQLRNACVTEAADIARLIGDLKLSPEIRKKARRHVMDATRLLASMPGARRIGP